MTDRISVVGLGRLGLCLAACLADSGIETVGVDSDEACVRIVNSGTAPWFEPGLDDLLSRHAGRRLTATVRHRDAIEQTDMTFILVPTPADPDGGYSNRFVAQALRPLAEALRESAKAYHLFVISSTVMPGSTDNHFIPLIEKHSGRKHTEGFAVCYNPEFSALGNVVDGFRSPDIVIIGTTTPDAGARLESVHRVLCLNRPAVFQMAVISAEIAKVCLNTFITTKISFANSIANLCELIPGADVDAITAALGADRRISPYYFRGGPGFGGTCFPRDTKAYMKLADAHHVQAHIIEAADRVNTIQDRHLLDTVLREAALRENKTIGILGLAFTSNTPAVTDSPAIKLIPELLKQGLSVVAYNLLAAEDARAVFGDTIEYAPSASRCLESAGLCVLTLRDTGIMKTVEMFTPSVPLTVIDCWRMIDPSKLDRKIKYVPFGRHPGS